MGNVKRSPQLTKLEHRIDYRRMTKADIIEAYRDLFREMGGVDELDDTEWFKDLQHRIELLKMYRKAWAAQS